MSYGIIYSNVIILFSVQTVMEQCSTENKLTHLKILLVFFVEFQDNYIFFKAKITIKILWWYRPNAAPLFVPSLDIGKNYQFNAT